MRKAVKLWNTSQYWKDRAAGAIQHAKYKELPAVRARRIKTIEADKRKHERNKAEAQKWLRMWTSPNLTLEQARAVANDSHMPACRTEGREFSWHAWDVLRPDEERYAGCPAWTVEQCQEKARKYYPRLIEWAERWIAHLENRLAYERAMLAEAGGIATDKVKPEKGGACKCWASPGHGRGWSIIQKVNRVSVTVLDNWGNGGRNFTRTIPFDKLRDVMSKAQVESKRAAGLLTESANGLGFFLAEMPPDRQATQTEPEDPASKFEALAEQLREGVKVVSAPNLFPTPPEVARRIVELADIQPGQRVLEPSAGTGSLLDALPDTPTVAVEINGQLAEALQRRFSGVNIHHADFLSLNGELLGKFDRIVMNPPFFRGSDLDHIRHAFAKLKPGGRLVAICVNGPRQVDELACIARFGKRCRPAGVPARG